MKGKLIWPIFWTLIAVFFVLVIFIFGITPEAFASIIDRSLFVWVLAIAGAAILLLGAALIFFTVKEKVGGMLKKFLLLTGASAAGLPVFAVLHNLVYALLILWFGEDFWGANGDEPVFFILATIVCPIGFLVGAVGTIVLANKNKRAKYSS
jgi:hypothetical protein